MRFYRQFLVLAPMMICALIGCSKSGSGSDAAAPARCTTCALPTPTPTQCSVPNCLPPTPSADGFLKYNVEEREIGKYAIHFKLSAPAGEQEYHLYEVTVLGALRTEKLVTRFQENVTEWVYDSLPSGETHAFEYRKFDTDGAEKTVQSLMVVLPHDVVIDHQALISDYDFTNVARIHFTKDGVLAIHDQTLMLNVKTFVADAGAKIESYPQHTRANDGKPGRSGGNVILTGDQARGELEISLNGEDAGIWVSTPPALMDEQYRGPSGAKGGDARVECGFSGDIYGPKEIRFTCHCAEKPGDGGSGGPGHMGVKGFQGLPGGDIGNLYVSFKDGSGFILKRNGFPGRGGTGSLGGPGGPGGFGGEPGKQDDVFGQKKSICTPARKGNQGQQGPAGPTGEPGADGKTGIICIGLSGPDSVNCLDGSRL